MAVHIVTVDSNNLTCFSGKLTTFSHIIHVNFFEIKDIHNKIN